MASEETPTPISSRIFRMLRMALHLAKGLIIVSFIFPLLSAEERVRRVRDWSRALLHLLNIRMKVEGRPPMVRGRGAMMVANHVSWLDIFTLDAICPAHFVSKSEVKRWPVLGWLARKAGTLFLERERRTDISRVNRKVMDLLNQGDCVAFFPEGTTTDGIRVLPFRSSLLQPVIDANADLWPVALRYIREDGSLDTRPAYIDDMSFHASLATILSCRQIRVNLRFLTPISADGLNRRALALSAFEAISSSVAVSRPGSRRETPAGLPDAG
jgi:1-acyl-sn-glycerol-3-phosphate acyltransferase